MDKAQTVAIEKIKKLLALAGNNDKAHEAEAAMLKAQDLLKKFHLEMTDVEGSFEDTEVVEESVELNDTVKVTYWQDFLASIVADNFRCMALTRTGGAYQKGHYAKVIFIGETADAIIASHVYSCVIDYYQREWKKYSQELKAKRQQKISRAVKNSYTMDFIAVIGENFRSQVQHSAGMELMVIVPDNVKSAYDKIPKGNASTPHITHAGDLEAAQAGREAGKRFNYKRGIKGAEQSPQLHK